MFTIRTNPPPPISWWSLLISLSYHIISKPVPEAKVTTKLWLISSACRSRNLRESRRSRRHGKLCCSRCCCRRWSVLKGQNKELKKTHVQFLDIDFYCCPLLVFVSCPLVRSWATETMERAPNLTVNSWDRKQLTCTLTDQTAKSDRSLYSTDISSLYQPPWTKETVFIVIFNIISSQEKRSVDPIS